MNDQVPRVRHLRTRVLRVRMVDVIARSIQEGLVAGQILLMVRRILLTIHLKSAGIRKRVFLVVVPENPAFGILLICIDEENTTRNRVKIGIVFHDDPELDLGPHDGRYRHLLIRSCRSRRASSPQRGAPAPDREAYRIQSGRLPVGLPRPRDPRPEREAPLLRFPRRGAPRSNPRGTDLGLPKRSRSSVPCARRP
jgi:hypothetical protein